MNHDELIKILTPFALFGAQIENNPFMSKIPDDTPMCEMRNAPTKADFVRAAKFLKLSDRCKEKPRRP